MCWYPLHVGRRSLMSLVFLVSLTVGCDTATTASDSGGSTGSSDGGGTSSTCATSANDFYVIENAACTDASGKLSRVNPDTPCKEELLTGLNCPVDFVLSTVDNGIGYLSSRSDGILQVNLTGKTTTTIVTATTIVSPAGLFLLENITEAEREDVCGGNTLVDAIILIADEGTQDGGMVWRWCLITDDAAILAAGSNPSPVSELAPSQVQHPRGVLVQNRTQVYVTGQNPDIADTSQSAVLATWVLNALESNVATFVTSPGDFSSTVKDLVEDTDGTLLIADPGQDSVLRYDPTEGVLTTLPGFTGGPRDILPIGANSDGVAEYLVSAFDDASVSRTTLVEGSAITEATADVTLSGPDGMDQ